MDEEKSANETWYDEEIAPALKALADQCGKRDMSFLAVVEYDRDSRGHTLALTPNAGLEMIMINHCAKTVPNVDGYIIGLVRYFRREKIPCDSSIVMNRLTA